MKSLVHILAFIGALAILSAFSYSTGGCGIDGCGGGDDWLFSNANEIANEFNRMQDGIYYADSIQEAQDLLDDSCGENITGSAQSGCTIQFTRAEMDNGGVTLHLAGDGTAATGRAGVILRGVGGGTAAGAAGSPNSGTIIKSGGAVPVIDVGACMGCMIENLTIAGEDTATVGIDFLAPASTPTTRFVIRNVAMYEINGYGIRTSTTGQLDTLLVENVSVRDSDGCYEQRYSQNIGIILSNFDCSLSGTASGPMFDIEAGEFNLRDSFVSVKNNEVAFRFGVTGIGRVLIDGNQIEFPTSTSAVIFDFDEGTATNPSETTISNNHFVYNADGNTLFDVERRGSMNIENNIVQNTSGSERTFATDFKVDGNSANNRLLLGWSGNSQTSSNASDSRIPERWIPTLTINAHSVYPDVSGPVVSNSTLPLPCYEGEIGSDWNAAAGARVQTCISGAWSAP